LPDEGERVAGALSGRRSRGSEFDTEEAQHFADANHDR